jgi:hypothetical protein
MLRIAVIALLASTTVASAQFFERRQPTVIFGPNGNITTVTPTFGGAVATDTQGNMAVRQGNMITIMPQMPRVPMLPTLTPRTDSNFD